MTGRLTDRQMDGRAGRQAERRKRMWNISDIERRLHHHCVERKKYLFFVLTIMPYVAGIGLCRSQTGFTIWAPSTGPYLAVYLS